MGGNPHRLAVLAGTRLFHGAGRLETVLPSRANFSARRRLSGFDAERARSRTRLPDRDVALQSARAVLRLFLHVGPDLAEHVRLDFILHGIR